MEPARAPEPTARPIPGGLPVARTIVFATLALVVLGAALTAGALAYTSQPSFCNSCHQMETRYVSWQRSAHADVTSCLDCHSEPGFVGEITAHLNGARYLYTVLTTEESGWVIHGDVRTKPCLECHEPGNLPRQIGPHLIEHQAHVGRDIACLDCHSGLVHGTLQGRPAQAPLERCATCHSQTSRQVVAACETCHGQSPARQFPDLRALPVAGRGARAAQGAPGALGMLGGPLGVPEGGGRR